MADLFMEFLSRGVNELFASGDTFTSIARGLREDGLRFADSRLRSFRDWSINGGQVPFYNYEREREFSPDNMKLGVFVEPGQYSYRISYTAINNQTGETINKHSFQTINFYGTEGEILDYLIPRMVQLSIDNSSDITYVSFTIDNGYKSILE